MARRSLRWELRDSQACLQAASKQVLELSSDAQAESAKLRASYQQQISTLEAQVCDLERALHDARCAAPMRRLPSPHRAGQQAAAPAGALAQRVEQLEAANAALERALLDAHGRGSRVQTSERRMNESDAMLHHVQASLAERDAQLAGLQAELGMLRGQQATQVCSCSIRWHEACGKCI
jgi:small-conductance mechanosensitive channel